MSDQSINDMEIGAFYQCYKRPEAVIFVLSEFRKHYPNSDIFLVSDGGYNYEHLAQHFNCIYKHGKVHTGNGVATIYNAPEKILTLISRWKEAAQKIKEDYILLLEDDVYVMNRIIDPLEYDINGMSNPSPVLGIKMTQRLKLRNRTIPIFRLRQPFSAFGGSIFKKSAIIKYLDNAETIIKEMSKYDRQPISYYASDKWLSIIILFNGGTIGPYNGHCDVSSSRYHERLEKGDISVVHQYKEIYNKALTETEIQILGNYK